MTIPQDLALWLDADARERLESLPLTERRRCLDRIEQAREPEVRERRIARTVQMLRDGRR